MQSTIFEIRFVPFNSLDNLHQIKFQQGVKCQQEGQFSTCKGSLYNESSKKGHFSTLKNDRAGHFSIGSIFNITLARPHNEHET